MKRKLSPGEAALWARVAGTVQPIDPRRTCLGEAAAPQAADGGGPTRQRRLAPSLPPPPLRGGPPARDKLGEDIGSRTLDASWDRKLAKGLNHPDFTIDLHDASLDAAHSRLDHGLTLAMAQGARLVLLITGRPRPAGEHAGRGERRGAIRAKFLDWLAAGSHASRIAAIRPAHPRHGGAGAVYLVLRRINSGLR